jgi:hypothetical protein
MIGADPIGADTGVCPYRWLTCIGADTGVCPCRWLTCIRIGANLIGADPIGADTGACPCRWLTCIGADTGVCPYQNDDAMNMVWHDNECVYGYAGIMVRQIVPHIVYHPSRIR